MSSSKKSVPLFDIPAQHAPLRKELERAALRVLKSGQFVLGPEGEAFEKEFARAVGAAHGVGVSSGTSALHLALQAAGVGPGDGVLTVPFTFIGTTIAVLAAGARVQFADVDPDTLTMDPADAARRLRPDTRALLPVHLYGYPADTAPLLRLARAKGLRVIEDAAQAHLAERDGVKAGAAGDVGCFSFYVSKNLGAAGDAGLCVTNDAALAGRLRMLRNNGSDPADRYNHPLKGYNARLDELQAAVLRVKLKRLAAWTRERRKRADLYRELLAGLPLRLPPPDRKGVAQAYHLFVVRTPERDRLKTFLANAGVASGVYYPKPLHLQPAYQDLGYGPGDFPVSEQAAREVLALPVSPEVSPADIRRAAGLVRAFFKK